MIWVIYLYIYNAIFTNALVYTLVYFISFASIVCGIFVIISKNPIVSVLYLIGLFLSIACYLITLGLNFIGLSYLLVYVGAVSILFLFILMLINIRVSELTSDSSNSIPLDIFTCVFFNITLYKLLPYNILTPTISLIQKKPDGMRVPIEVNLTNSDTPYSLNKSINLFENNDLFFVTSQIWDGALAELSHITNIGNITHISYPLRLILTSLILILAMVQTIVITIKQLKKR